MTTQELENIRISGFDLAQKLREAPRTITERLRTFGVPFKHGKGYPMGEAVRAITWDYIEKMAKHPEVIQMLRDYRDALTEAREENDRLRAEVARLKDPPTT